jgi:hypothetical protein
MLGEHKPARAVIPCKELHYGYQIEIEASCRALMISAKRRRGDAQRFYHPFVAEVLAEARSDCAGCTVALGQLNAEAA